jgi:hypothetical protein
MPLVCGPSHFVKPSLRRKKREHFSVNLLSPSSQTIRVSGRRPPSSSGGGFSPTSPPPSLSPLSRDFKALGFPTTGRRPPSSSDRSAPSVHSFYSRSRDQPPPLGVYRAASWNRATTAAVRIRVGLAWIHLASAWIGASPPSGLAPVLLPAYLCCRCVLLSRLLDLLLAC